MSRRRRDDDDANNFIEKVIYINRVAKVVKGGRRFSFSAIVVVGDGEGKVGVGFGKANEVPEAIRKGSEKARRAMKAYPLVGGTIAHEVLGRFGAGRVLLKPAAPGTGVIAGPSVRGVMEALGVHNLLTKSLGSSNAHNLVKATIAALEDLESAEQYAQRLGKDLEEVYANYTVRPAEPVGQPPEAS
ncbi:MAG: 30S ribosomal protein S5 [Deltaproteobacteria bacterium]|nr:30S ribosomal protein S5 [Deltaproteobacteria bacterium]MBW2253190.1 30S ribosomal protein S5 [Deltaproteobacteria bacterium]